MILAVNVGLALLIGAFGVLQNALNRQFAPALGLPWLLLVNGLVLAACGIVFFFALRLLPDQALPPLFRVPGDARAFQAVDLLPGLLGFFIITTAPWAIERMGATRLFIGVIVAQLIASMLWDWWVEGISVSVWRVGGGVLALLGAALASR